MTEKMEAWSIELQDLIEWASLHTGGNAEAAAFLLEMLKNEIDDFEGVQMISKMAAGRIKAVLDSIDFLISSIQTYVGGTHEQLAKLLKEKPKEDAA